MYSLNSLTFLHTIKVVAHRFLTPAAEFFLEDPSVSPAAWHHPRMRTDSSPPDSDLAIRRLRTRARSWEIRRRSETMSGIFGKISVGTYVEIKRSDGM